MHLLPDMAETIKIIYTGTYMSEGSTVQKLSLIPIVSLWSEHHMLQDQYISSNIHVFTCT